MDAALTELVERLDAAVDERSPTRSRARSRPISRMCSAAAALALPERFKRRAPGLLRAATVVSGPGEPLYRGRDDVGPGPGNRRSRSRRLLVCRGRRRGRDERHAVRRAPRGRRFAVTPSARRSPPASAPRAGSFRRPTITCWPTRSPDAVSVTLHVYGGDLNGCRIFTPDADGRVPVRACGR